MNDDDEFLRERYRYTMTPEEAELASSGVKFADAPAPAPRRGSAAPKLVTYKCREVSDEETEIIPGVFVSEPPLLPVRKCLVCGSDNCTAPYKYHEELSSYGPLRPDHLPKAFVLKKPSWFQRLIDWLLARA